MQPKKTRGSALPLLLCFFVGGPILLFCVIAVAIASYFFVGPELRGLRNAVLENSSANYDKKFEMNVGRFSFGLAGMVTPFISEIPPEARTLIRSAKGAQVSIFQLRGGTVDQAKLIETADRRMEKRGWTRIVGVIQDDQTVAIYIPNKMTSAENVEACVLAVNDGHLVCAYARSNLQPLLNLALQKAQKEFPNHALN